MGLCTIITFKLRKIVLLIWKVIPAHCCHVMLPDQQLEVVVHCRSLQMPAIRSACTGAL